MSKKEPKTELLPKSFNSEVIVEESLALSTGVAGLIPLTKNKGELNKILANEHARGLLMRTMTTFISVDMRFDVGMRSMGEILHNIINKGDEKIHRKAIEAICEAQAIPTIEYNPKAPVKSFALALFAKFPEMAEQVKNGKDTKGALRIQSYMAAYKLALNPKGKTSTRTNGSAEDGSTNPQPRSAYDLFMKCYEVTTAKDRTMFLRILKRAEIEYEKWIPKTAETATTSDEPETE